jgi:hypothetical protein
MKMVSSVDDDDDDASKTKNRNKETQFSVLPCAKVKNLFLALLLRLPTCIIIIPKKPQTK